MSVASSLSSEVIIQVEAGPSTYLSHLLMPHAQNILHQVVSLADQLHVAILYPVVHHLHKVPRPLISHLLDNKQGLSEQQTQKSQQPERPQKIT